MPDFAGSKTQRADIYIQGFSPRIHPRQACSLDCIAKLRFAFHPALPARQLRQTFCSIQHVLFRRHPANNLSPHIFLYWRPHNLPPANDLHSGLTGQCIPSLILFSFFSFFFYSTPHKKRKPAKPISFFFLQSQI